VLLAYPCAAWGTAHLARALRLPRGAALFAGLAFALCGALVSQGVSVQYVEAFSRIPWVLWAALRLRQTGGLRFGAALGLALASTLWAGDPEVLFIATAAAAALVFAPPATWRARAAPFALAGAAAVGLTLPLLLPAVHAFAGSARAGALTAEEALSWSLHPARLAELAWGSPFADASAATMRHFGAQTSGFWSPGCYAGVAVVALACLGLGRAGPRWRFVAAGCAALALWLATGRFGHLYAHAPGLMHFRYPEKLVPWACLAIALLAGRGLVSLRRVRCRALIFPVAALAALGLLGVALYRPFGPLVVRGLLVLGLSAVVGAALRRPRWRMAAVACVALADLAIANRSLLQWGPIATYLPARSPLPEARPGERVCSDLTTVGYRFLPGARTNVRAAQLATLDEGLAGLYHLRSTLGLTPAWPADLVTLCSVANLCGTPCARRQGARLQWVQRDAVPGLLATGEFRHLRALDSPVVADLVEDLRAPPYASVRPARTYDRAFPTIAALHLRTLQTPDALVDRADAPSADAWTGTGEARASASRPSEIQVQLRATAPALLVVREAETPDWHATLDGAAARIIRADFGAIGVPVPEGAHTVALTYRPFGGAWSYLGYGLALLACLGAVLIERRRA